MAIKENALPVSQSIGSGDYLRKVSSGGVSQQVPFSEVKAAVVTVDPAIDSESENPVQNKAIAAALDAAGTQTQQAIASAIQTEVADRNSAISQAISTEVSNRNTAISEAVAAEAQAREAADEELNQSKANTDGNYPDMTVGNADQLLSSIYTEDQIPYNFRQAGGGISIGDREIDKIVGGTISWNQQMPTNHVSEVGGVTVTENGDGSFTLNGTATGSNALTSNRNFRAITGHKYLLRGASDKIRCQMYGLSSVGSSFNPGSPVFSDSIFNCISEGTGTGLNCIALFGWASGTVFDNFKFYPQVFDLTQLFGSAIADYIYSLEQATAGAGVAYFKKLFPKPYYAYNAGELMSVQAASHDMVGFNQFDKDTAVVYNAYLQNWSAGIYRWTQYSDSRSFAIRCLPNTTYCAYLNGLTPQILRLCSIAEENLPTNPTGGGWYVPCDGEAVTSSNGLCTYTTGANSKWLIVQISSQFVTDGRAYDNLCINLAHNGSRNGEYEPYEKHSYELDANLTLRGIQKLDASNNLYYDGDTYESDGTVTRKYGIVDLGSLSWTADSDLSGFHRYYATVSDAVKASDYRGRIISVMPTAQNSAVFDTSQHTMITGYHISGGYLYIISDTLASVPELMTYLGGIDSHAVYELATPTTEQADPYTNPQTVSDWGTEEYVDAAVQEGDRDVAVPVGHVTDYLANLRDKLQNLPDAANADGTYLVQQTSGQMALLAYTPGVNIPAAPTTDGTYTLQAVVSGGVATYSWVSN